MRKPLLLAAALALLTTACRAEVNFILDVADDGSGELIVEFGIDDELFEQLAAVNFDIDDLSSNFLPEDRTIDERREGDMNFYATAEPFAGPDALLDQASLLEESGAVVRELDLEVDGAAGSLDMLVDIPSLVESLAGLGAGGLGLFGDAAEDAFMSSIVVALPGDVKEHNADEVLPDGRLRWNVPLLEGGTVDVHVVTEAAGSGSSLGLIVGIVALVIVLGGGIWLANRRRRASVSAIESMTPPEPASPVFDGETSAPHSAETRPDAPQGDVASD